MSCVSSRGNGSLSGLCAWRRLNSLHSNEDSNNNNKTSSSAISSYYETCSGNPATCPDLDCDELEMSVPALCPQDCISAYIARHSIISSLLPVSLEVTSNRYFLRVRLSVSKDLIAAAIY